MNDVAVALEHVDLLDGLDGLDVELLQGGLELLVVTARALVDLLDLPARSTLASITIIIRQRGALDPLSHAKKSKGVLALGSGARVVEEQKELTLFTSSSQQSSRTSILHGKSISEGNPAGTSLTDAHRGLHPRELGLIHICGLCVEGKVGKAGAKRTCVSGRSQRCGAREMNWPASRASAEPVSGGERTFA